MHHQRKRIVNEKKKKKYNGFVHYTVIYFMIMIEGDKLSCTRSLSLGRLGCTVLFGKV